MEQHASHPNRKAKEESHAVPLCRAKPSPSFINLQASSPLATFLNVRTAKLPSGVDPKPKECLGLLERTIFLWTFWPSFNSAPTMLGDGQHRTTLNTYYSLTASTLSTFALSALVGEHGRLDMVHIQNAALAGGVVVGTSGEMMLTPFGALAAGFLAGTVSTLGYKFFTPVLEAKFKLQDTCGVHNLHGMPGVLGALLGVLVAGLATHEAYGDGLGSVFPLVAEGQRSAKAQAMYQLFGLLVTLTFASVGGALGGLLLRLPFLDPPPDSQCYEDQIYWEASGGSRACLSTDLSLKTKPVGT
ncbi:ammonium transporter Rh type B-like [Puma concolor]|uniref:Ammonium transporter Rh type B n=1 Tax=Puma concolor TaxID=9696 RepID=A0A6P6H5E4_PUMCO|nr:ammonium transporter Rh type B-like [Puma concolor]